jgi:hypothetical protein
MNDYKIISAYDGTIISKEPLTAKWIADENKLCYFHNGQRMQSRKFENFKEACEFILSLEIF